MPSDRTQLAEREELEKVSRLSSNLDKALTSLLRSWPRGHPEVHLAEVIRPLFKAPDRIQSPDKTGVMFTFLSAPHQIMNGRILTAKLRRKINHIRLCIIASLRPSYWDLYMMLGKA